MSGDRRAFVIVIDACGFGALPDAADYGDAGADTLSHCARAVGGLELPALGALGLGSIAPLDGVPPAAAPVVHGRLRPLGPGKDTTSGHWELMGVVADAPARTYPDGFPPFVADAIRERTGRGVLCNRPYSGIEVIADYGPEHLRTGELILYTSQDSVLQLAAHVDVLPTPALHELCGELRALMQGEHAVNRVIARPFEGAPGAFVRTDQRRDFALPPPRPSYLDALRAAGVPVHGVGKIAQVFAGQGVDHEHKGPDNPRALAATDRLVESLDRGLAFVNLVDTDQVYGHRRDPHGFHTALREIDAHVAAWLKRLDPTRDLLAITADHGCDPTAPGSDHTREHAPLLAWFSGHGGRRHDGAFADVGASALAWLAGTEEPGLPGEPFI